MILSIDYPGAIPIGLAMYAPTGRTSFRLTSPRRRWFGQHYGRQLWTRATHLEETVQDGIEVMELELDSFVGVSADGSQDGAKKVTVM